MGCRRCGRRARSGLDVQAHLHSAEAPPCTTVSRYRPEDLLQTVDETMVGWLGRITCDHRLVLYALTHTATCTPRNCTCSSCAPIVVRERWSEEEKVTCGGTLVVNRSSVTPTAALLPRSSRSKRRGLPPSKTWVADGMQRSRCANHAVIFAFHQQAQFRALPWRSLEMNEPLIAGDVLVGHSEAGLVRNSGPIDVRQPPLPQTLPCRVTA